MFSRERLLELLRALDAELARAGATAEICLFGGAAMVLAFDARTATRDVDAVFVPKDVVLRAIAAVAEAHDESADWMNDAVKGFVSAQATTTADNLPVFANIRLLRPTDDYLLAMKCLAARAAGYDTDGDRADVALLLRRLNLRSVEDVLTVIGRYYHDRQVPARTRYFVEETLHDLWTNARKT
jgi:hypothetical protein